MKKYYLFLILATTLCAPVVAEKAAEYNAAEAEYSEIPDADPELNPITITVSGTQVRVTNAAEKTLEIYNLAGVRVASYKIENDDTTVSLNLPRGCYILKVDKVVRKAAIK